MAEQKNYALTIAIPTYNRLEKLKICLKRLMEQKKIEQIEIIVSDNASTDGTGEYMTELVKKAENIRYYRNTENVGPDKNFLNCFDKAVGEYVLLLGDDDFLLPMAVEHLLDTLEKKPVFLHLNTSGLVSESPFVYNEPRWEETGLKVYSSREKFLEDTGIFITFMSSLVFRTELVRRVENKEQYIGTYFIQSYIALATMREQGIYIIDTYNYLAASGNETVGYDLYEVWFYNYHKLILQGGKNGGFSEKILSDIYYKTTKNTVRQFVIQFRCACKNQANWRKTYIWPCLEKYHDLKRTFWVLVNCPVGILRLLHIVWVRLRKIKNVLH